MCTQRRCPELCHCDISHRWDDLLPAASRLAFLSPLECGAVTWAAADSSPDGGGACKSQFREALKPGNTASGFDRFFLGRRRMMKNALSSPTGRVWRKEEHQSGRTAIPFDLPAGWIRRPRQGDEEGVADVSASPPDECGRRDQRASKCTLIPTDTDRYRCICLFNEQLSWTCIALRTSPFLENTSSNLILINNSNEFNSASIFLFLAPKTSSSSFFSFSPTPCRSQLGPTIDSVITSCVSKWWHGAIFKWHWRAAYRPQTRGRRSVRSK